jgi:solute carrier family 25 uncoupling protein 27
MQSDGRLVTRGIPPRYINIADAFAKIIKEEGFLGLWRGLGPNVQRAFLVNMGELSCYDGSKHFLVSNKICHDNVYAHTLASMMSGLCATTLSCPADVIKTRIMSQANNAKGIAPYRNSIDCLVKTVQKEGILALWKGFFPTWARLGPWQLIFWVSYERMRKIAGMASF